MTMKPGPLFAAATLVATFTTAGAVPTAQDAINEFASNAPLQYGSLDVTIGFFYTPAAAYSLTGVQTRFGSAGQTKPDGSRNVTIEVWDERPGSEPATLLRTGSYAFDTTDFDGIDFAGLDLVAGEDYFIGFRGVRRIQQNTTFDGGATSVSTWGNSSVDGAYDVQHSGSLTTPILRFIGEPLAPVPEPASMALMALGLLAVGRAARKTLPARPR